MHGTLAIHQETVLFVVKPNYKYNFPKLSGVKLIPNAATVIHEHILLLYGLLITVQGILYYYVRITVGRCLRTGVYHVLYMV